MSDESTPEPPEQQPMPSVRVPEWVWKLLTGVMSAVVLGTMSWAWSAEARISSVEGDVAQCVAKVETIQSNASAIRVLETRLQYIEQGIDEIKELLKDRP